MIPTTELEAAARWRALAPELRAALIRELVPRRVRAAARKGARGGLYGPWARFRGRVHIRVRVDLSGAVSGRSWAGGWPHSPADEFDPYLVDQLADPEVRAAYDAERDQERTAEHREESA